MFTVNDSISPPFRTNMELNGVPVCMEIDTEAAQSISREGPTRSLPRPDRSCHWRMWVLILVDVHVNKQRVKLTLVVIKRKSPSLIGCNWLTQLKLDWTQEHKIDRSADEGVAGILLKHSAVFFKEGMATFLGFKPNVHLKKSHTQVLKSRSVSYSLHDKLEKELQRLQDEVS